MPVYHGSRPLLAARRSALQPGWLLCVAGLLLGLLLPSLGCKGKTRPPEGIFGQLEPASPGQELTAAGLGPYLMLARGALSGVDAPAVKVDARPGRRVFLTVYEPGKESRATTGLGATLRESVLEAARRARRKEGAPVEGLRLQLDVVEAASLEELDDDAKLDPEEAGTLGVFFARDAGTIGFVLPGEVVQRDLYESARKRLRRKAVLKLAASRAQVKAEVLEGFPTWRMLTLSALESSPPGKVLAMSRGMVVRDDAISVERLREAARAGAEYLTRSVDAQGRYDYSYRPLEDKVGNDYNMLRHCGATYSLLEAYEQFGEKRYLEAAERALTYSHRRLRPRPAHVAVKPGVGELVHMVDEEKGELSKMGGAGLFLIAHAKHAGLTGSRKHLELMRGVAQYILHQQEPNGHFISYFDYQPDKPVKQKEILYYPGEAMLGLMRLYALDPDPRWLAGAVRGASYLMDIRDAKKTEDNIEHDHWLSIALNELYRTTEDRRYVEHAFKIARAIERKQKKAGEAPDDFVGGFYGIPNSTPSSVRLEAYAADIALARRAGEPDNWLLTAARPVASFIMAQQFTEQNSVFLKNPARALGGVRESVLKHTIQIDYVQHALSGMLGLAAALEDPTFGKSGKGGLRPVKALSVGEPIPLRAVGVEGIQAEAGGSAPSVVLPGTGGAEAEE